MVRIQVQILKGKIILEHSLHQYGYLVKETHFHQMEKPRQYQNVANDDRRDQQSDWDNG